MRISISSKRGSLGAVNARLYLGLRDVGETGVGPMTVGVWWASTLKVGVCQGVGGDPELTTKSLGFSPWILTSGGRLLSRTALMPGPMELG